MLPSERELQGALCPLHIFGNLGSFCQKLQRSGSYENIPWQDAIGWVLEHAFHLEPPGRRSRHPCPQLHSAAEAKKMSEGVEKKMSVARCYTAVQRHMAAHPDRSREEVVAAMKTFPACAQWDRAHQERILQTSFAPLEERGDRPLPMGYMRAPPDVLRLQHERFWRGFLLIGTLLLILGVVLYTAVPSIAMRRPMLVAFFALAATYICVGVWRTLRRHGIAGFGKSVAHIFAPESAFERPRAPTSAAYGGGSYKAPTGRARPGTGPRLRRARRRPGGADGRGVGRPEHRGAPGLFAGQARRRRQTCGSRGTARGAGGWCAQSPRGGARAARARASRATLARVCDASAACRCASVAQRTRRHLADSWQMCAPISASTSCGSSPAYRFQVSMNVGRARLAHFFHGFFFPCGRTHRVLPCPKEGGGGPRPIAALMLQHVGFTCNCTSAVDLGCSHPFRDSSFATNNCFFPMLQAFHIAAVHNGCIHAEKPIALAAVLAPRVAAISTTIYSHTFRWDHDPRLSSSTNSLLCVMQSSCCNQPFSHICKYTAYTCTPSWVSTKIGTQSWCFATYSSFTDEDGILRTRFRQDLVCLSWF